LAIESGKGGREEDEELKQELGDKYNELGDMVD
jgi:hypothetical protein